MKHLKLFFALFAMLALGVGNAWGETVTYQHVFNQKPSTGNSVALSSVNWKIEATALNNYNSNNYAGVQIGSSKAAGSITLTSTTDWDYDGNGKITEVRLWLNTGGSTVTPTVTIGGKSATSDGTKVVKNSKAGTDWTKATKVTFTPVADGNTGVVVINVSTVNAGYICAMEIDCEPASSGSGSEEPVLSVEPKEVAFGTKNIYFESEKEGDLEIDITGQNLTGDVTAAISGTDASVFTTSKTTFTPNSGEVSEKLSVSYSVSEVKNYTATLTLSSDGVDAIELPITLTTVNKKPTIYTKVTDATTLSAGDKVIFVYEAGKKAAGTITNTTGGYLNAIDITQALNTTANPATASITDEAVVEYTLGGTTGAWELISAGNKLSEKTANSSSSVDLKANGDTKWTISITEGNATIKGSDNTIQYNASSPRFKTYTSGQKTIQLYAISVPKYAVNFTQPEGGKLIVKNGENAIVSGNTFAEGIKLTVTANPANGYEGGTVVVEDADGNDVPTTVYADGVLTMPAYAVTISATFDKKECTLLATPTVSATTTYNSATLSWGAVTKAAKYSVKIGDKEAVETTATSYEVTDLNAETTYTYQVQAIAEAGQDTDCDSKVAEGTFTTIAAPVATLTLKDIVGTTTLTGSLNGTITLPTEAAECSKTFVGWSAVEIPEPGKKPATHFYDSGAEYTLAAETQTLYAVYADGEAGESLQWTIKNDDLKVLDSSQSSGYAKYAGDQEKNGVTFNITSVMPATGENAGKIQMQAEKATIYNKTAMPGNIISIAIDGVDLSVYEGTEVISSTPSSEAITKNSEVYNFSSGKRYFHLKKSTKSAGYANSITVTYASAPTYSNYSTTCAAAPIATVVPTSVTATVAGGNGKVEVTYENVNTANVSVALFNDEACTEAFTAGWLTAALDGDKNVTYTVAENTIYAERKAYIKLTAPETTGATDPDVVVIPVTQAAKDKVFASLAELVAADLTAGDEVTVTLNNDVIKDFYIYSSKRCGVVFDVQKDGKDIKIYFNNQTTIDDWAVGGKLSGTLTNVKWTTYSSAWQLAPANTWAWANLTYTEPKAVSTVVVSGDPTKTTYVDGEAFDPAGLTVTVNYNDATTEVNPTGVTFTVTPTTLVKGQTSVSVTATYNSVTSEAYTVNNLIVTDIQSMTILDFITSGGTRCYLEGIVSNITNTTYGNFDLTDASGTIYVYGCLNAAGESKKFADLRVKNGDKIKVIANESSLYEGKTQTKDVQYVSHKSAATIEVEDITMEVGDKQTISATVTPEGASVTYAIKAGSDNCITLNVAEIIATAAGTATIVATIAETADYMGAEKEFTVTVTAVDTRKKAVSPSPFTAVSGDLNPNNITFASYQGGAGTAPAIQNDAIRLYQISGTNTYGGYITLTAVKGCMIDQVEITTTDKYNTTTVAYSVDGNETLLGSADVAKLSKYSTPIGLNTESVNILNLGSTSSNRLEIASITVYYTGQPLADPELSWTSNAVGLRVGETFTAPTLNNPYNVTGITYRSDNESLAKVNETTGAVTLVPDATGTATITAEFEGNDTYKAVAVSYTINVKHALVYGVWELVTDVNSLAAGDKLVIVAKDYEFALSATQGNNNREQAAVTKNNDNTVAFGNDVQVLTLETGAVENTFALNTGNGYLYAASSSSNYLRTETKLSNNSSWAIAVSADGTATIVAKGSNTRNTMQYNQTSSVFACYASASQKALCLYMKKNVKVEGETDNTSIPDQSDVTVDNAELTVTTEAEYDNMYIGNNGSVDVEEKVTVNNLYIQTTMGTTTSGQLNTTPENIIINGDAFIDITLGNNGEPSQWHAFTVPFPVDAMNGVYDLNDNQLKNEVNYAIMDYHGDIRANGQYGWKKYRGILVPGTFYLMTVDGNRTTYRFKKVKDAELIAPATKELKAYNTGSSDDTKDKGWNGVGNPTLMHGKVDVDAQILDPVSYAYVPVPASSAHFTVGTPFFIQAAADATVTIAAEVSGSLAPARRAAAAVENIKVMLGNSDYTDRLYVSASEDAINEYEIGKDLAKMTMTKTPSVPQIFAEAYNTSLCMIDAPMANNEAVVALNLYAPAEGEYTISTDLQENAIVYLMQEGTIVWNLSMGEYPITLKQGDNAGYSLLVRRADAPTSVETIEGANNQTDKLIHNGNLYILHNGKVFDAVGSLLK